REATQDANGQPIPAGPGLTKGGALLHILATAARGAAMAYGATSPREGADRAREIPIEMAQQRQQLQTGGLENQQRAAMLSFLPTHFAMQRADLANTLQQTRLRNAQEEYYRQRAQKLDASPEEEYRTKLGIAQRFGLNPEETKQFVFSIKPEKETK